jgi:hypothetical protein
MMRVSSAIFGCWNGFLCQHPKVKKAHIHRCSAANYNTDSVRLCISMDAGRYVNGGTELNKVAAAASRFY